MLQVSCKVGVSSTHGMGLFANEVIKTGTVVWRFDPTLDLKFTAKRIRGSFWKSEFLSYFYRNKNSGAFVLCADDARFMNHSFTPNIVGVDDGTEEGHNVAARDIEIGEEITCDYSEFDDLVDLKTWKSKINA